MKDRIFTAAILLALAAMLLPTTGCPTATESANGGTFEPGPAAWKVKIDSFGVVMYPSPTIVDDLLLLIRKSQEAPYRSTLYALDAENAEVVWTVPLKGTALSPPILDGNKAYFLETVPSERDPIGSATELVGIDTSTGSEISRAEVAGGSKLAAVSDAIAVFHSFERVLTAKFSRIDTTFRSVDAKSGDELWRITSEGSIAFPQTDVGVTTANGTAFLLTSVIGNRDLKTLDRPPPFARINAVNLRSGEELWTKDIEAQSIRNLPIVDSDVLYVRDDKFIRALVPDTGEEIWSFDHYSAADNLNNRRAGPDLEPSAATPDASRSIILAGGSFMWTFGLHPETGKVLWQSDTAAAGSVRTTSIIANEDIYAGDGGDRYIAGHDDGYERQPAELFSIDPMTGEQIWKITTPKGLHPQSLTASNKKGDANKRIYYAGMGGYLYAISDPSQQDSPDDIDLSTAVTITLPADSSDDGLPDPTTEDSAIMDALLIEVGLADPSLAEAEREALEDGREVVLPSALPNLYQGIAYAAIPTVWSSAVPIEKREAILTRLSEEFEVSVEEIGVIVRRLSAWAENAIADSAWSADSFEPKPMEGVSAVPPPRTR